MLWSDNFGKIPFQHHQLRKGAVSVPGLPSFPQTTAESLSFCSCVKHPAPLLQYANLSADKYSMESTTVGLQYASIVLSCIHQLDVCECIKPFLQ